jgi:carbamoyl-phosphate synthase large subunit
MRSTGEVMGVAESFGDAYAKAQLSAGVTLPKGGVAFISVNERDKLSISSLANGFRKLGFDLVATSGTAERLRGDGLDVDSVYKVNEGRPNIVDLIRSERVDLVINTPLGKESFFDEKAIRRACIQYGTPCITTLSAAAAAVRAIQALQRGKVQVLSMQEYLAAEPD